MSELIKVLTEKEIDRLISSVAQKISEEYKDKRLVLIGVLKGAFVFLGDLARKLTIPVEIDFIQFSSYGNRDSSSGDVQLRSDISSELNGKNLLVVEDIIDTGLTITKLIKHLESFNPESIRVCTFIDKHERREVDYKADYACYSVEGGFLVGYGLDYAEKYRNLPALYHLNL
ncbi:MAG: hypoxanthine phosphoribosyltransferase [Desulfobacteraceae bacterium]|jgi:hypoxanthine phosphoribosyltransferase|nr:hypoxanthine phosphoribosyltransferase [Desulfobacteraceae bacterium]